MSKLTLRERLWRKTEADPKTGCWVWKGYVEASGYGRIWFGSTWLAHRASWVDEFGPIPNGLHVCHRCDNPPCWNPDHLFLGTNADNVADRHAKGRSRGGYHRGETHPCAKLTADDVRAIRAARGAEQGRITARRYGVSPSRISMIQTRKVWDHV